MHVGASRWLGGPWISRNQWIGRHITLGPVQINWYVGLRVYVTWPIPVCLYAMRQHPKSSNVSESSALDDHRAELFGAGECEEAPFWVSVEKADGTQRTEAEALATVKMFWGEEESPIQWVVKRVPMYVSPDGYGGLRVSRDHRDGAAGPFDFWDIDWE